MKPSSCHGCQLQNHGHDFSAIEGSGRNGVLVVAEASGEQEARDLLPLRPYAPAGALFERTLRRLGLDRQDFAITNLLRCRPRSNLLVNMPYESAVINSCRPNLEQAYNQFQPRVILALGNLPFSYLAGEGGKDRSITNLRGYILRPSPHYSPLIAEDADLRDVVIMPTYHPSHIRRGMTHLFGVFARDVMRAVNIAKGVDHSYIVDDPLMALYRDELQYVLTPTIDEGWAWYNRAKDQQDSPISYDLETQESASLDEDAREEFSDTRIRQYQFSIDEGEGIALPNNEEFRKLVVAIMRLPNPKVGWNNRDFDDRVLRARGEAEGDHQLYMPRGQVHDAMRMWQRWQPELPANLQYASTFTQFPFPWKHLNSANLPFYGICDTDSCLRNFNMLTKSMAQKGILDHYEVQVAKLHDLPSQVAHRGLTISGEAARKLIGDLVDKQKVILAEMEALYPNSEKTYSPEEGYKKTPKQVEERRRLWNSERMGVLIGEKTVLDGESESDYVRRITGLVERTFLVKVKQEGGLLPKTMPLERWCNVNPVSPMSRPQIMRYAKVKKHEIPTKKQQDGSISESLTLDDIDLMFGRTKDKFYWLIGQHRRLTEEKRVVSELEAVSFRGAIHANFQIHPSGRLTSKTYSLPEPGTMASSVVVARPGHKMVWWRWPGQWERILAQLVGDETLIDVAGDSRGLSQVAWEDLKVHPVALKGILLGESDRAILMANRVIFGTAQKKISDMRAKLNQRWPSIAKWQESQRALAHRQFSLTSRFGEIRWFYEVYAPDGKGGMGPGEQSQAAVEFQAQADCVGAQRWRLGRLNGKTDLVAMARDWLMFEAKQEDVMWHVRDLWKTLNQIPTELGPINLPVEVWVGDNWASMQKLDIRT